MIEQAPAALAVGLIFRSSVAARRDYGSRCAGLLTRGLFIVAMSAGFSLAAAETGWSFDQLRARARSLAQAEFQPPPSASLPDSLRILNYDQFREIRFRPEAAPWKSAELPYSLRMIHRGYIFNEAARLWSLENSQPRELKYSSAQFDFGRNPLTDALREDLGYAGFALLWRRGGNDHPEVASFAGASYFRLVGGDQIYGASARGLAIDTGESGGEEFPHFTEFWIERPPPQADYINIYALLNSPSAAGAFRFSITAGPETTSEVEASLFLRDPKKKIGLAPLTSMFLTGENRTRFIPDFRPEIHDSDGLLIRRANGERIWRPLVNPEKRHQLHRFAVKDLEGFGLLQRDRKFANYEDLGARYELRPTLWVKPLNTWGPGVVELVEIPTETEYNDNIAAYWVPEAKPLAGQELRLKYQLSAVSGEPDGDDKPKLRVASTRITPQKDKPRFVIDFAGNAYAGQRANVQAHVNVSEGQIENLVTQENAMTGGWRVFFDWAGATKGIAELRAWLSAADQTISETWVYHHVRR